MPASVTVVIPCYNAERWIAAAIQSALDQDGPSVEVIVVDDGSTDGSRAAIRTFGGRVRLLEGGHRGANHARNLAWRQARGGWVQFLDADDYLLPQKISRQLAEATEEDVIFSPVLFEQGTERMASALDPRRSTAALWLAWELPQTGGGLWRKGALEKIGGWNEATPCCQEYELYARALQAGLRFRFSAEPGAVYRVWSGDTLCRKDPTQVVEVRTQLYRQFVAWLRERGELGEEDLRLAGRACFEMARTLAREDLPRAERYHRERQQEGLLYLAGPAAPPAYRALYRVLGFSLAEKVARVLRPKT
jgi:hypothetical protein